MAVRAVRGATHLSADDADEMRAAVVELLGEMLERNGLSTEDLISVLFTATPDLVASFPASAARSLDIADVPLICAQEIDVTGAMAQGRPGHGARGDRPGRAGRHPRLPARDARAARGPRLVSRLPEPVLLVGTGLIGTSVALALRRAGVQVLLSDRDPEALALASARGAGHPCTRGSPPTGRAQRHLHWAERVARAGDRGSTRSTRDERSGPDEVPLIERDPVPGLVVVAVPPARSRPRSPTRCGGSPGSGHRRGLGEGADPARTGRRGRRRPPLRGRPSDGRPRGVRAGCRARGPPPRPALGDHPARGRGRRRDRRGARAGAGHGRAADRDDRRRPRPRGRGRVAHAAGAVDACWRPACWTRRRPRCRSPGRGCAT